MAASSHKLGSLHEKLTEVLLDRLDDTELCSAADLAVARQFLKDNNVTAVVEDSATLGELEAKLEQRRSRRASRQATVNPDPNISGIDPDAVDAALAQVLGEAEKEMMNGSKGIH